MDQVQSSGAVFRSFAKSSEGHQIVIEGELLPGGSGF
jgi:hypothetical protein